MRTVTYPLMGRARSASGSDATDLSRDIGYDYRRKVGAYIQDLRISKGMTQIELARALGVRDTAISAIELGRNSLSPERYAQTADALGVDRRKFGKFLCRYYNPWLFALLFPNEIDAQEIEALPERLGDFRNK